MFFISLFKKIYFYFKKLNLIQNLQQKKQLIYKILKKNNLFYLFYFFINFYFFSDITFCEGVDDNFSIEDLKAEDEKIRKIEKIIMVLILTTIFMGFFFYFNDGFPTNNCNDYYISEERLEHIKKLEEAQRLYAEKFTKPSNVIPARICPHILYNCDVPPGGMRDDGLYDYLD